MTASYQLQAVNGPQVINMADGNISVYRASLAFGVTPSAGTVIIEKQSIGSSAWEVLSPSASVTGGRLDLSFDGAIRALRVTFTGLVGGSSPILWLTGQPSAVPPMNILTDKGTGPNSRLRVDVGQTGFFAGRMFRNYIEALIPLLDPLFNSDLPRP